MSAGSSRTGGVTKLIKYHAVPSMRRYVTIEQTRVGVTVYARQADDPWTTVAVGAGDALDLPEIGIEIPVDDIFEGVTFDT